MKSALLLRDPATPEEEKLWSAFDTISKKVKAGAVASKGGSDSENQYNIAWQALVREGLVAPIKRKYRG